MLLSLRSFPSLAVATSNSGKLQELAALIGDGVTIVSLSCLGLSLPEETGASFAENACAKASFVASETHLLTIADDSGLEVDALGGTPGIHSARYAGPQASDQDNRNLLLERLKGVPLRRRSARFICVLAIADASGKITTITGSCNGMIAVQETGSGGFGYDPIFMLEDGRTMAQLSTVEKNNISHRGIALRTALPILLASLPRGALQHGSHPEQGERR